MSKMSLKITLFDNKDMKLGVITLENRAVQANPKLALAKEADTRLNANRFAIVDGDRSINLDYVQYVEFEFLED